jgi:TolB-like protein
LSCVAKEKNALLNPVCRGKEKNAILQQKKWRLSFLSAGGEISLVPCLGESDATHEVQVMQIMIRVLAIVCLAAMVAGCAVVNPSSPVVMYQRQTRLIEAQYAVADTLRASICGPEVCEYPIMLASFVNLENLDESSPLGRIIPQQIGSRMVQQGMNVVDVRLRTNSLLILKGEGEFALSRELEKIKRDVDAYGVLTGTYTVVYGQIYVTAMVLRSSDGVKLASMDYVLPMDRKALGIAPRQSFSSTLPAGRDQLPDPTSGTIMPSVLTRL